MNKSTDKLTSHQSNRRIKELTKLLYDSQDEKHTDGKNANSALFTKEREELNSLLWYCRGMSIERKKGKNGSYKYYVTDIDGEIVGKLSDYYDGVELKEGKWLFKYKHTLDTYEVEGRGANDHREYDYIETLGGATVELYAILDSTGDVIFDGIIEVEYVYHRDEFIVEIESSLFKDELKKTSILTFEPIRCVIDCEGEIIVGFTNNRIYFNSVEDNYL